MNSVELEAPVRQIMRTECVRLRADQTVDDALHQMRTDPPRDRILYFYVVDDEGRLQGVVPTRRLLLSAPDQRIGEIMITRVVALPEDASVLDACEFFTLHRLLALPVIDDERRLVGVVDVDVYTQERASLEDRGTHDDLFQMIGVHLTEAQRASAWAAFKGRFPWLSCNLTGGILAAFLSGLYQDVLSLEHAVLALFIPVVLALAESVSIQSVSLTLEVLRGPAPNWRALGKRVRLETITGFLLGVSTAGLVGAVALIWRGNARVAAALFGGIAGGVTAAAVLGLLIPYLLRLLRRDPQVAAGPIALALADLVTLLLYFNLGRQLLGE